MKSSKQPAHKRPWWQFYAPLAILWPTEPRSTRALRINLVALASISIILSVAAQGSTPILLLYSKKMCNWDTYILAKRLQWSCRGLVSPLSKYEPGSLTYLINVADFSSWLCSYIPLVIRLRYRNRVNKPAKIFSMFEARLIQGAIAAELLGFLGHSLSYTGSLYILSGIVSSLRIVSGPALQAALVNHASSERSGEALSASEMLHAAARLITPTAMNSIYCATVGEFPQAIFLCAIAIVAGALLIS
jgi:hypothetical protein